MPHSARPELIVEGKDDLYALAGLLVRHGIDYETKPWPANYPVIRDSKGVDRLLDSMEAAIKASSDRPVGFVVDANGDPAARWDAIRMRLQHVGFSPPSDPVAGGFSDVSSETGSRVGVWMMPDNASPGAIEAFLLQLIDGTDPLLSHAVQSTAAASALGAKFGAHRELKAQVHAWLAWQEEPGRPYGSAIRAQFIGYSSASAARFVEWFRDLYGIELPSGARTPA
jgi:hypothetical protein